MMRALVAGVVFLVAVGVADASTYRFTTGTGLSIVTESLLCAEAANEAAAILQDTEGADFTYQATCTGANGNPIFSGAVNQTATYSLAKYSAGALVSTTTKTLTLMAADLTEMTSRWVVELCIGCVLAFGLGFLGGK
jgi:hypothetical protein